jgi:hypothetical protein
MPIKCHPGIKTGRAPRGAALEALHFQRVIATELTGRSLARTGSALNQRLPCVAGETIGWPGASALVQCAHSDGPTGSRAPDSPKVRALFETGSATLLAARSCGALAQELGGSGFTPAVRCGLLIGTWEKRGDRGRLPAAEGTRDTGAVVPRALSGIGALGQAGRYFHADRRFRIGVTGKAAVEYGSERTNILQLGY